MSGLRLAVVTRRFWPMADEPESWLADLLPALKARGARPTIITAQWKLDWPTQAVFREMPLIRLPHSSPGGWGTLRFMRRLATWLRNHHEQFDVVLVSRLRLDAHAVIGALRDFPIPVVVRAEGAGELGDVAWLAASPFGHRLKRRVYSASSIVAGSQAVLHELTESGCPEERIRVIAPGVSTVDANGEVADESMAVAGRSNQVATKRLLARESLGEACADLMTNEEDPVFLFVGRLHRANNLTVVLQAWTRVAQRWPRATLWMIGDGPERGGLYRRIVESGVRQQTFLPGSFDDLEDVFLAADVFLAPARAADYSPTALRALAFGLPVIASDVAGHRELLGDSAAATLVPPRDASVWVTAMLSLADDVATRQRMSQSAIAAAARYSLDRAADEHMELFEHLLRSR